MPNTRLHPLLSVIRKALNAAGKDCPDRVLLERFVIGGDTAAFEAILRRHGVMVLDVCRSLLPNEADVEDAFQATFLILAKRAKSIRQAASLASWLHGVAYRVACKSRTEFARRRKYETSAFPPEETKPADDLTWRELRQIVHEELNHLPEQYRDALTHCYLEGMTQDQAAAELNLPKGTLKGHLERGRALLRSRLVRRGIGPAAMVLVCAMPTAALSGELPAALVASTVNASAGLTAATPSVVALVQGYLHTVFWHKVKVAASAVAVLALACLGSYGLVASSEPPQQIVAHQPRGDPEVLLDDADEDLWANSSDFKLALCMSADPRHAKLSEPTTLSAWLRNMTDQPIRVIRPFGRGANGVNMKNTSIRGQAAHLKYTGPHDGNGLGDDAAIWLQPRAVIQDHIVIRNASRGFRLRGVDMPNVHTITIEYVYDTNQIELADVWNGKIQSKSVVAEIKIDALK